MGKGFTEIFPQKRHMNSQKTFKKCLISLVIRKIKIKTTMILILRY